MWTGERTTFFEVYDVASAAYIYGRFSMELVAPKPLKTTGASTTIEEVTSGDNPFSVLAVQDRIAVQPGPDTTVDNRTITAKASDASATISGAAVDWSAVRHFRFRKFLSGTGADDGWVALGKWEFYDVHIVVATINATNIKVTIEGRNRGAGSAGRSLIAEKTYAAAGDSGTDVIGIAEHCDEIRVGLKVTGDVGAQSVSVYGVGRNPA